MINIKGISGFEDKLPESQLIEENFKEIIRKNYSLSGFTPLDTPNVERVEVLTSKGADDNEIYGIKRLKSEGKDANDFEMGLRFDLTVPLARYVSKYEGEISFPFKRQHIARVYRGERPQKGRYREFYQADVDIIGNGKLPLFADVEIIYTIYSSLKELDFGDFVININNKKLLSGYLGHLGIENISGAIGIIDKKDKVNEEKLISMFEGIDLDDKQVKNILDLINFSNTKEQNIIKVFNFFEQIDNNLLKEGLSELKYVYDNLVKLGLNEKNIIINPTISRGLNYYTGLVFETFIDGAEGMGSISSGGRYDDLCSMFSKNNFPGVGGSIGLSRLLAVLTQLDKLKFIKKTVSKVLVLNLGENVLNENLELVRYLRDNGINTEIYLDDTIKFAKQIKYADNKKIDFVLIMGENEIENGIIQIKNLDSGEQSEVKKDELLKNIK